MTKGSEMNSEQTLSQWHYAHHKSYNGCNEIEPRNPQCQGGGWTPEPCYDQYLYQTYTSHKDKVLAWQWRRHHDGTGECVVLLALNSHELTSGYLAPYKELHKGVLCGCGGTSHTVLQYFRFVELVTVRRNLP